MTVSSSTNRVSYSGNGTLTTFAYTFKVFDESDLTVILRASDGTETVQTITTNYTVSGVGDAGGGNVTFVTAPASGVTVVILRELSLNQGLDLVPNDPFPAQSLEDSLDKLTFMVQQHNEELSRAIKASRTNTISGSEFTISASDRANKVFSFDGSGDLAITQELGVFQGDWAASTTYAVRDIVKDTSTNNIFIANTAHTSSGAQPLTTNTDSAKWDLLVDAASATASAAAAAASETAAEAAQTAAEAAQTAAETAQTAAETAETNAETAETNAETAQAAAEAAQASAEAVYDNFDDRYLGAKSTVSGDPTLDNDGDALIDGALFFDTTNNVMKVYNLGTTTWLRTTPTSAEQTNIDTVSSISANVTTVAGISGDVTTVAGISANTTTVAGISANVTTVAGISSDVTTVASNVSDIQNFAEVYRVGSSDPVADNDTGDLFYNTTSSQMKVYNGSAWEAGVLAGSGTLLAANNLSDLDNAATAISNLGITATVAELNYVDGVTSNIQTQIDGISADPTLGSLTKSFASGESSTITLSSSVSPTPIVAVTKEVGQTGASSKGAWDVNATASNYELYDEAPATSLSLSSTSADGTATLGTGSFTSSDVGKRIYVDDGGEAVITATDGSYSLSSTFGSSSYTSGNWSLSGLDVDATNGITLSGLSEDSYNVSTASYNQTFSVSTQEINPTDVFFKPDGTKMYIVGTTGDDVNQYNLSTAWDISSASYSQNFSIAVQESSVQGLFFRADGLKMYVSGYGDDAVNEYDLSTAWDISTASHNQRFSVNANNPVAGGVHFRADGLKMYVVEITATKVVEYDLSTAWDISTASYLQFFSAAVQPRAVRFKPDGLKMYVGGQTGNDAIYEYDLSTAWDVSTASLLQSFDVSSQESNLGGLFFRADGFKMYIVGANGDEVNEYDVGSRFNPTAQYFPALTSAGGQIDSTYWTDINSMTADDNDNDGQAYYAVSTDDRTTWSIAKASDGERDIVRNNGGTWQYNSNATYASTTWSNATTNDEFAAIAQAMTVSVNQMDKTQLDAVTDGSHFALSNTLDLAIILYLASSGEVPTSDGVSINYDAAALNKGAVLGTDYDYDFPAGDKVRITSLAAQNLKVRVA